MRRVMVVLPEPVPPQIPMTNVFFDGGILVVRYENMADPSASLRARRWEGLKNPPLRCCGFCF